MIPLDAIVGADPGGQRRIGSGRSSGTDRIGTLGGQLHAGHRVRNRSGTWIRIPDRHRSRLGAGRTALHVAQRADPHRDQRTAAHALDVGDGTTRHTRCRVRTEGDRAWTEPGSRYDRIAPSPRSRNWVVRTTSAQRHRVYASRYAPGKRLRPHRSGAELLRGRRRVPGQSIVEGRERRTPPRTASDRTSNRQLEARLDPELGQSHRIDRVG